MPRGACLSLPLFWLAFDCLSYGLLWLSLRWHALPTCQVLSPSLPITRTCSWKRRAFASLKSRQFVETPKFADSLCQLHACPRQLFANIWLVCLLADRLRLSPHGCVASRILLRSCLVWRCLVGKCLLSHLCHMYATLKCLLSHLCHPQYKALQERALQESGKGSCKRAAKAPQVKGTRLTRLMLSHGKDEVQLFGITGVSAVWYHWCVSLALVTYSRSNHVHYVLLNNYDLLKMHVTRARRRHL